MEDFKKQIIGYAVCILLLFSIFMEKRIQQRLMPQKTINHLEFKENVQDGDLLGTLSSNNFFSCLHSYVLGTPIAHVGIAIVDRKTNGHTKVFMFESGAIRGAQLRNIDEYMNDGAERLWWRKLNVDSETRQQIVLEAEKISHLAYSWTFLKSLPYELFSIDPPGYFDDFSEANSCGDLIAKLYRKFNIVNQNSRKIWLPMHFLHDLPYHDKPINVVFDVIKLNYCIKN